MNWTELKKRVERAPLDATSVGTVLFAFSMTLVGFESPPLYIGVLGLFVFVFSVLLLMLRVIWGQRWLYGNDKKIVGFIGITVSFAYFVVSIASGLLVAGNIKWLFLVVGVLWLVSWLKDLK